MNETVEGAAPVRKYSALIGFEIPSVRDRKLWNIVLKNIAPTGHNVFGIATSDAHNLAGIDKGWVKPNYRPVAQSKKDNKPIEGLTQARLNLWRLARGVMA